MTARNKLAATNWQLVSGEIMGEGGGVGEGGGGQVEKGNLGG